MNPSRNLFLAILVALFPRQIPLFACMLGTSIVYNIGLWPQVPNHIVLESLLNMMILAAIGLTYWESRSANYSDDALRQKIIDKLAPVVLMTAYGTIQKAVQAYDGRKPHWLHKGRLMYLIC